LVPIIEVGRGLGSVRSAAVTYCGAEKDVVTKGVYAEVYLAGMKVGGGRRYGWER
jgi:hypothetical protein